MCVIEINVEQLLFPGILLLFIVLFIYIMLLTQSNDFIYI